MPSAQNGHKSCKIEDPATQQLLHTSQVISSDQSLINGVFCSPAVREAVIPGIFPLGTAAAAGQEDKRESVSQPVEV